MIVLSVGMPRAGSGWYYNLTHDLICAAGGVEARQIRRRYRLGRVLTEVNCNIGALTPPRLLAVLPPALLGNTFAIKAHAGPTTFARALIRSRLVRATYIYRDPRDALLSAFDYGQRASQNGRANAFSKLTDFETAVDFMLPYLKIWAAWSECKRVLHVRYEDLLMGYDEELQRLISFLGIDGGDPGVKAVSEQYRPGQADTEQKGLHFNIGQIGRFRQALTAEQQEKLNQAFAPYIERMGYPL